MQAVKTIVKPAAKSAARKTTVKTVKPPVPVIAFGVHNGYRPGAGRLLFAFTQAWLHASGLLSGKTYAKAEAIQVAGATAIAYHLGNGNLTETKGALTLSDKGKTFFVARGADIKAVDAFVACLRTGKPDATVGLKAEGAFKKVTL